MPFERLRDDAAAAVKEAKTLGCLFVVCPWIPHDKAGFTADDAAKAAAVFNEASLVAKGEGLRLAYHAHGYEFLPAPGGPSSRPSSRTRIRRWESRSTSSGPRPVGWTRPR